MTATLTGQPTDRPLFYTKAGPAYLADDIAIGASLGCRYYEGRNGVDVSVAGYGGFLSEAYILPSIRYMRMIQPSARQSIHFGIGGGYGRVETIFTVFHGMLGHASLGYDLQWGPCHFLLGADLLQPTIPFDKKVSDTYLPVISLNLGLGF